MNKTVFISSTYRDLVEHRRAVWQMLGGFDVSIRGMEQFGARTETPLATCLAEVEQSDVYVGILVFRIGSIESESAKSFTQLEYEHALQLKKEILIYMVDEQEARVRYTDIDVEQLNLEKLNAFKRILRERHTINTFTSPEDLAEKLRRDFKRHFVSRETSAEPAHDEFAEALTTVKRFLLMPKSVVGRDIRLRVSFTDAEPYPAARELCRAFNLDYGATIGVSMRVTAPEGMNRFGELYASGRSVDELLKSHATAAAPAVSTRLGTHYKDPVELYARLRFSEEDVNGTRARFFGETYYPYEEPEDEPGDVRYLPPEGRVILLFSKLAS
jgi:Domain of unknown function (DUF4062)